MKSLLGIVAAAFLLLPLAASAHSGDSGAKAESKVTSKVMTSDKTPATEKVVTHSGGTDAYGCHTNRKTGEYHCH
ncbi:YHYH domain-containing protein [Pseudomonadota bacterium]